MVRIKTNNIGMHIFFATLILLITCCNQEFGQSKNTEITLSHYQRLTISPSLYKEYLYRDIFEGVIDFNFIKFRIPFIRDGTITIEEISTTNNILTKTLEFRDSLLISIADGNSSINLIYDDNKNLISDGNMEYKYTNGKLTSKEWDLTIHTFIWKDKCVLWKAKDKNSSYTTNSKICFNEYNKTVKDFSSFTLEEKLVTEEFQIQYNLDTLISHNYIRTENKDTTVYHIVSNEINHLGLLSKSITKVVNEKKTYETAYKYELSNNMPLIVSKFKLVNGKKSDEVRYTFNEKDQLVEFEQLGKYGEKYKILYHEK